MKRISLLNLLVKDQDAAIEFYTHNPRRFGRQQDLPE
jgi:hypothetical protein